MSTIKIGGMAGQGIKSAGLMLAKFASRSGYHTYDYTEYPSLIRGGHNVMQIRFSKEEVTAPSLKSDFLIALNKETIDKHYLELKSGSGVLFESKNNPDTSKINKDINLFPVPLSELARTVGNNEILINTVSLGATIALLGGDLKILDKLINEEFQGKGEKIIQLNQQAAAAGFDYAAKNFQDKIQKLLTPLENIPQRMVINGNDTVALGAIAAGLQFAAIYPMSPISNILHILAQYQEKYGFIYKQPEDEISAINMAIGASYAGARSMTATSGGGFCLMSEGYGLAGMTETPLVIIEGMRPGPATGFPTWSEQGDLRFIIHAHQGDFPRIVLAAGDAKEAFDLTLQAFNLAEKYQTPVVVIIDKNICENDQTFSMFDISSYQVDRGKYTTEKIENYERFSLENDGISTRTIPGKSNFFIANSDEHDSFGYSNEESDNRNFQMNKRMTKLNICAKTDMPKPQIIGPLDADITLVSWGSNKGSILQTMKKFENVNYLHLTWMNPFPTQSVKDILNEAKYVIDIECNYSGQLAGIIKENCGIDIKDKLLKYDGRPFFEEEIEEKIKSVLSK